MPRSVSPAGLRVGGATPQRAAGGTGASASASASASAAAGAGAGAGASGAAAAAPARQYEMLVHQTKRMHNRRELIIGELTKLSRQQRRQLLLGTPRPAAPPP